MLPASHKMTALSFTQLLILYQAILPLQLFLTATLKHFRLISLKHKQPYQGAIMFHSVVILLLPSTDKPSLHLSRLLFTFAMTQVASHVIIR